MADYTGRDQRLKYLFQNGGGGGECKVISGYYHDGDFYEDQSYTQIITGSEDSLYIDLDTTTLYLFDGTDYVEVQGGGGGAVSDGTVGVRIDKYFTTSESKTYTYDELGITAKGYYILGIATNHSEPYGGWKWYGIVCYSGNTTNNYSYVKQFDSNNINVTMDSVNNTITIQNTNGNWAENFRIEVLPLHPKIEVEKHAYSTTEQVVGTWVDGKPIYEITIALAVGDLPTANSSVSIPHGIANFKNLISAEGFVNNGSVFRPISNARITYNSGTNYVIGYVVFTDRVYIESAMDLGAYSGFIILKYTKTTD